MIDAASIDSYLLEGRPNKETIVKELLETRNPPAAARAYLEGIRALGARTPDLAFIALRLTLAGKPVDDASVLKVRELTQEVRKGKATAESARAAYDSLLR